MRLSFRKLVVASTLLIAFHALLLTLAPVGATRSFLSNLVQFVSSTTAAWACISAGLDSKRSARQFWVLLGASYALWSTAQFFWILYGDVLGLTITTPSPLHLLFFFAYAPAAVALLQSASEKQGFDLLQALDFAQISMVLLATYYYVFFMPSLWPTGYEPSRFFVYALDIRNLAIVIGLFIMAGLERKTQLQRSILKIGFIFAAYTIANAISGFEIVWLHKANSGALIDLTWSVPFLLAASVAASWRPDIGDDLPQWQSRQSSWLRVLGVNLSPFAIPFLVLLISSRIAMADIRVAAAAVSASVICYGLRTTIIQGQQQRTETRFQLLFTRHPQPMFVFDANSLFFLEVNDAAIAQYGYNLREFLNLKITDIRPAEDVAGVIARIGSASPSLRLMHVRHRLKSGKIIHVDITAERLEFAGHRAILAVAQDVSHRMALEQQLRQSQKMEAVGTLAGGVAHDFNNLLTVIKGYSNMLAEGLTEDPHRLTQVLEIERAADRAAALTRQLLAFSRQQIFNLQVLDLNLVVDGVTRMLERLIGEHIFIIRRLAPDLGKLKADPNQLDQVLMNLAVNARDAMPQGGRLIFETANVEITRSFNPGPIEIKHGKYIMLRASDTGCGMSEEVRAQAFDPFFTTKEQGQGTGLGLSTVYGIVKQSDGYIFTDTAVGRGTSFTIYLPRIDEPVTTTTGPGTPSRPGVTRLQQTVLVVEDEQPVRTLVRNVLASEGFHVLEAEDGLSAEALCREYTGTIHLLLTDSVMPGMNGHELASRLTVLRPEMKIAYMSGYSSDDLLRGQISDSDTLFLEKPFTPLALLQMVFKACNESTTA